MSRTKIAILAGISAVVAVAGVAMAPAEATSHRTPESPTIDLTRTAIPPHVTGLAVFDHGAYVAAHWHNPMTPVAAIVVRYAQGARPPSGPRQGLRLRVPTPTATSARFPVLLTNTKYAVAVWTRDTAGQLSAVRTATFTTRDRPPRMGTVVGTVTDVESNPLARVRVLVDPFGASPLATVSTGSDGRYSVRVPAGPHLIVFDGSKGTGGTTDDTGYAGDARPFSVSFGDVVTANEQLKAGAAITGRVTDPTGHPLVGVDPYALPASPYVQVDSFGIVEVTFGPQAEIVTGANGTFTAKGLPRSAVQVCFDPQRHAVSGGDASDYLPTCRHRDVVLVGGHTAALGDTVLEPSPDGAVVGKAIGSSGTPVANALVEVTTPRSASGGFSYTAADGSFRVALPPGRYQVCIDPTTARTPRTGLRDTLTCSANEVSVVPGQTTIAPDLHLRPGAAVAGVVRGPDGAPLRGVYVAVEGNGALFGGSGATTDAHGQFLADGLAPGRYRICFYPPPDNSSTGASGACTPRTPLVAVRAGLIRLGADIQLGLGGAVAGRVTDNQGHPVSGAFITSDSTNFTDSIGFGVETGPRGYYRMNSVRPGKYYVCFDAFALGGQGRDGCYGSTQQSPFQGTPVTVRAGRFARHIDMNVGGATGAIRVHVDDGSGHPIGGVDAVAIRPCRSTDYNCTQLPAFSRTQTVDVVASWSTDASGSTRLPQLAPGNYAVCLFAYEGSTRIGDSSTGYVDSCQGSTFGVAVTAGLTTSVTRTLAPAGEVTGTITDGDGHPLAGVVVTVSHAGASDYAEARNADTYYFSPSADTVTGPDGKFAIHGVAPGTRTVCFDASTATGGDKATGYLDQCIGGPPGVSRGGTGVTVVAGAATQADLGLSPGGAIRGTVVNALSQPIAGTEVLIMPSDPSQPSYYAVTGSAGHYNAKRLVPGSYTVCFTDYPLAAQCYDNVSWNEKDPPVGATPVAATSGSTVTGIDAVMRHA